MRSTLTNEFHWGKIHEQDSFTATEALSLLEDDKSTHFNSTFKIMNRNINIDVCNRGRSFSFSTFISGNSTSSTRIGGHRILEDLEKLAELIADFSIEKAEEFAKDEDYSLKEYISIMSPEFKDEVLFAIFKERVTANQKEEIA